MKKVPTLLGSSSVEEGLSDAEEELADAEEELPDAEEELPDAEEELSDAREDDESSATAQAAVVESRPASELVRSAQGASARMATAARDTAGFLSENATALTLIGLGASLLAIATGRQTRGLVSNHPIAAGAIAVATGVGIAMALPETQLENSALRPVARDLTKHARGLVGHVRADVQSARNAVGGLRDSLSRSALGEG